LILKNIEQGIVIVTADETVMSCCSCQHVNM